MSKIANYGVFTIQNFRKVLADSRGRNGARVCSSRLLGVPMLLQGRKTKHLLSGGDAQFAVYVFVVVFQRVFGNTEDLRDLLGVLPAK